MMIQVHCRYSLGRMMNSPLVGQEASILPPTLPVEATLADPLTSYDIFCLSLQVEAFTLPLVVLVVVVVVSHLDQKRTNGGIQTHPPHTVTYQVI